MWGIHGNKIKELTGVSNVEEYKNNPNAQEQYQNYLGQQYKKSINSYRSKYNLNVPDETLMMLTHYLGESDANVYLKTLSDTKDYNKAQQAVNDSIIKRTGKLPKNIPIKDYLTLFNKKLNA